MENTQKISIRYIMGNISKNRKSDYFFQGRIIVSDKASVLLDSEEIESIHKLVREMAKKENGLSYLHILYSEKSNTLLFLWDNLGKAAIRSGRYDESDNHCTLMLPEEAIAQTAI